MTEANAKAHQLPGSEGLPATPELWPPQLLNPEAGFYGCAVSREEWGAAAWYSLHGEGRPLW